MMKRIIILFSLFPLVFSCEKVNFEVPVRIINKDGSYYSNVVENALTRKLKRRNFIIVDDNERYTIIIDEFFTDELIEYETVYDDCNYGVITYELTKEFVNGEVCLLEGNEQIKCWNFSASESEYVSTGRPLLWEILFPNGDCEDESDDCEDDCTDYYVASPTVLTVENEIRSSARKISNYIVDIAKL